MSTRVVLSVPSMPRVVADGVFDAWAWCPSDVLEWERPRADREAGSPLDTRAAIDGQNPAGLCFVMHAECTYLPRELAALHAPGHGFREEWALAPYGIDDATDRLYEHRRRPREVLFLAARDLSSLVWGLHDWVHFHNHGPFDDPPTTELQCDLMALAWLRRNRELVEVDSAAIERVARQLAALAARRFADDGRSPPVHDLEGLFLGPYPSSPLEAP